MASSRPAPASGSPSVLYRRRGWSYGVLHLQTEPAVPDLESRTA